jgi:hypothetical protein
MEMKSVVGMMAKQHSERGAALYAWHLLPAHQKRLLKKWPPQRTKQ